MKRAAHGPSVKFYSTREPKTGIGLATIRQTIQSAPSRESAMAERRTVKSTGFTTNADEPRSWAAEIRPVSP